MEDKITIEYILNKGEFLGSLVGTEAVNLKLDIPIHIFGQNVPVFIYAIPSQGLNTKIYLRMEKLVNLIAFLDNDARKTIGQVVRENFRRYHDHKDHGPEPGDATSISTPEQTWKEASLKTVEARLINYDETDQNCYFSLYFQCKWLGDGFLKINFINDRYGDAEILS